MERKREAGQNHPDESPEDLSVLINPENIPKSPESQGNPVSPENRENHTVNEGRFLHPSRRF